MVRYDSDVTVLALHDYDLYKNREHISNDELNEIIYHCIDDDIHEYYQKHKNEFPLDTEFYKKLDTAFKSQIKEGVNEFIHALYLIFFSLLRIKYGKQKEIDIRITKCILYYYGTYCILDYHQFIPLTYTNKLFEIAKHDVHKHFKIPMDILPKEIPDDWTINRFDRWDWATNYVESCLCDEEKITYFHLCGYYVPYTRKHWLDKKLPEIKFDF